MEKGCGDARDMEGSARYNTGVSLHPSPRYDTTQRYSWVFGAFRKADLQRDPLDLP